MSKCILERLLCYFVVLYCVVLCGVVLYCVVLYCVLLCCIVLYCVVLCCVVLCYVVLYSVVLCCILLCCVVLYCVVLCGFVLSRITIFNVSVHVAPSGTERTISFVTRCRVLFSLPYFLFYFRYLLPNKVCGITSQKVIFLGQVCSPFQTKLSTGCYLALPLSVSIIFSFP
jgi:hypothetical protein